MSHFGIVSHSFQVLSPGGIVSPKRRIMSPRKNAAPNRVRR